MDIDYLLKHSPGKTMSLYILYIRQKYEKICLQTVEASIQINKG